MTEIFGATVAGSVETSKISRAGIVGNYETRLIEEEKAFEIAIFEDFSEGREATNFDEEAGNGQDLLVFQDERIEVIILTTVAGENFLIVEDFDICGILNLRNQGFFGGKMRATMNEKNFLRNVGKIRGSEKSGIATTDNGDSLTLIESTIASRTIGNAVANEFRFIDQIEATWGGAGGENYGFGDISLIAGQSEMSSGFFKMPNFVVDEGKTKRF